MNRYKRLKKRQLKELDNLSRVKMFFAINNDQYNEGMKRLNLDPEEDSDKVFFIPGGGYYLKDDRKAYNEALKRHKKQIQDAIRRDKTGEGFIADMFTAELNRHDFYYTGDPEEGLEACGYTLDDLSKDKRLMRGFCMAVNNIQPREW